MEPIKLTLRAARINAGLRQIELAKAVGVTIGTVVNWESGKTEPKPSQLEQISRVTRIPVELIVLPTKSKKM